MPNHTTKKAIFFDFDGVLVDSARLKTELFLTFYPHVTGRERAAIRNYCDVNGGIPRREKFQHIHENILNQPLSSTKLEELCRQYTGAVVDQVLEAPWIPGALEFLPCHASDFQLFVISGTPHEEINTICTLRGIHGFFNHVAGSSTSKADWIKHHLATENLSREAAVMIGDSKTDLDAAIKTGIDFLGVDNSNLEQLPSGIPVISNLRHLETTLVKLYTKPEPLILA